MGTSQQERLSHQEPNLHRQHAGNLKDDGSARRTVVFAQHCADHTGSTISGLLLAQGFVDRGWEVHVVLGSSGPLEIQFREAGCYIHHVPFKSWLRGTSLRSLVKSANEVRGSSLSLRQRLKDVKPDLVYVNSLVGLAPAIAARSLGYPVIWHLRELFDDIGGEMRSPAVLGKMGVRRIIRAFSDHRVAISSRVQDNLLGEHAANVTIVPNAVADDFFADLPDQQQCRQLFGLGAGRPLVGVPGTLRPVKGHAFFLNAARSILRQLPDCLFAITGKGDPAFEGELKNLSQELGLESSVRWLGTVKKMPEFYRACDVVCVPSESEPFGRTAIEALAIGVPLVASHVDGLAEIVNSGQNGLTVPFGQTDRLAENIVSLLHDSGLRMRLGDAGRLEAWGKYRREVYQQRIGEIADSVLLQRRVAST